MLEPGTRWEWSRSITKEDIRTFAEISGDQGIHHVREDAAGRLIAQGLLTATLPTKLGGDLNFLARTMTFDFLKPVYSGDVLTCAAVVDSAVPDGAKWKLSFSFQITNQLGEVVMKGSSSGVIRRSTDSAATASRERPGE